MGQLQQAASVQSAADSMSSPHAGAAWPPVPPPEAMWQQVVAMQQAEQLQHMQHKQLPQQPRIQQLLQQQRWEQQQQHKPLLRPPCMPEWNKTKGPLECENWTSGTISGQQLLRSTAPASYSSQRRACHRGRCNSQHYHPAAAPRKQGLLEHPILADTDTSPTAETK